MGGYLKFGIGGCAVVELMFVPDKPTDPNDYGDVQWCYGLKNIELIDDCILKESKSKYDNWYASVKNHGILKAAGVRKGDRIKIWRKEEMKYKLYPDGSDTPFPEPEDEAPPGEPHYDETPPDLPPDESSPPRGTQTTQKREEPVQAKYKPILLLNATVAKLTANAMMFCSLVPVRHPDREDETGIAIQSQYRKLTVDELKAEMDIALRAMKPPEEIVKAIEVWREWFNKMLEEPQPEEEFPDDAKAMANSEPLEIIDENPFISGKQPSKELCKYWNTLADKDNFKLIEEGSGKYTDPENRIVCYWDSKEERVVPISDPSELLPF